MKRFKLFALFFLCCSFSLIAQSTDEQLAAQYYQNKEYEKAGVYYEKLFNKGNDKRFYEYYLTCLKETDNFKQAEKLIKKQIKKNTGDLSYQVDLGTLYKDFDRMSDAKDEYQNAIKSLSANEKQVYALANAFVELKEWDLAIATYLKGRKLLRGMIATNFHFELAKVYESKGDYPAMVNEYLDMLEINDGFIQQVQNAMQSSFDEYATTKRNEILKTELLKRIQKSADKAIFSELLIWILIQQKDFEAALIQTKALDKRSSEDGYRVMELAKLCLTNKNYSTAIKAYDYVIKKGADNLHYPIAKIESLDAQYQKIVDINDYTLEDLKRLETQYINTLKELGKNPLTAPLMKSYAHLQGFYLHESDKAIELLEEAISIPRILPDFKAECKLELGDILLMTGDIWEASLKYSQVEKEFKHDPIGQEAKFRNARISYYTGNFKWAQAQLDVLKASTSKLIANDALDLSLLITDNTGIDTSTVPLFMFSRAELLAFQNKHEEAFVLFDSIDHLFPYHSLIDEIYFVKAKIYLKKGDYVKAAEYFQKIVAKHTNDIYADDALFKLAGLNEFQFDDKEKAMELYQQLLLNYPGSLYTVEARKRFRMLRGDIVN